MTNIVFNDPITPEKTIEDIQIENDQVEYLNDIQDFENENETYDFISFPLD